MVRFVYIYLTEIGKKMKKKPRLLKVKFVKKKQLIPSVVYPRLMQPHMLEFQVSSIKRKVILMGLGQP